MVWHGTWYMVWYGIGMVWYGMVWYGMVWYGVVWYGMVWHGMAWYGMVRYGLVEVTADSPRICSSTRYQAPDTVALGRSI